jgi:dienelactone hydrolase
MRANAPVLALFLLLAGVMAWPAAGGPGRAEAPETAQETAALAPGPQGPRLTGAGSQLWLIPLPGERLLMHALVMRPAGKGPFPLAVINHGSSQSSLARASFAPSTYAGLSRWFLAHGYAVVLPLRPGHGETGGPYFEDQGGCDSADYEKAGSGTAFSIAAAIDYMTAQDFVRTTGVVVVGQSAGGWGAIALASGNPPAVGAIVNFAGGRGGHADDAAGNTCSPERLVSAAGEFGRTARVPTLWLYAENDSYFSPRLSQAMFERFHASGGVGEYHLLPPTVAEGHEIIESADAAALWLPILNRFLCESEASNRDSR